MAKYTIGLDFGTLSGRAVLVNVETGEELNSSEHLYTHAVMETALPDGTPLGLDWALQHPQDYLDVFYKTIPVIIKESGVNPNDIIGVGVDFTACTFMPIKADGTPMCFIDEYKANPHAWIKLWKHHAAQDKANLLNDTAHKTGEKWISRYGGKISSEWQVPKVMQIASEAPEIYDATDHFIEAADWVIWALTGKVTKCGCIAGYKGIWHKRDGYPSKEFFKALDPKMENYVQEKLDYPVVTLGERVGGITKDMAEKTGLVEGTAVAAANIDAHVTVPALKIKDSYSMLMIMGTSTCHILIADEEKTVPGMCGVVEDGVYPGLYAYEAGQSCVGDHFAWFVKNCVPEEYEKEAKDAGMKMHDYLNQKAAKLKVGESGLVALDWWNGNRSVLVDVDLTGVLLGMTLQTKPEDIYRALIEATAYGTRKIIETFEAAGVPVKRLYASGGISQKSPLTMQIYSDVTGLPIEIAGSAQGPALGSAIYASVAAGKENGGYDSLLDAANAMGKLDEKVYRPIPENQAVYDKLFAEYNTLHDYFGRGENNVLKRLKAIKLEQSEN